jgi:hypothetical protein
MGMMYFSVMQCPLTCITWKHYLQRGVNLPKTLLGAMFISKPVGVGCVDFRRRIQEEGGGEHDTKSVCRFCLLLAGQSGY